MKKRFLAASVVVALGMMNSFSSAYGVAIVTYDLDGDTGDQASEAPIAVAPNITGLSMVRGAGITASAAGGSFSSANWGGTASDEYISFGFTVADGFEADLIDLRLGTRSSATGPGTIGIFYNGDSFTNALATISQAAGGNFVNSIIDLSGLTGLTGVVEFRLMEIDNTQADGVGTTADSGTFRVTDYFNVTSQDLTINGDITAVPEPAGILLGGIGLIGVVGLARARRNRA